MPASNSEYMLWTDARSRDFIAEHYAWFLDTFDNYTYPIQRADAIRYFVLYHYGGIYLDLDVGCLRPLDPLLVYPVILPKTIPVGVSNDLMFSEKGHEFLFQAIHNLAVFDHSWILNYPTVMFSTGPMFISIQYGLYASAHGAMSRDAVRILPKSLYGKNAKPDEARHSFFVHYYGSSWHADDAGVFWFLAIWGRILILLGLAILLAGLAKLYLFGGKSAGSRFRSGGAYDIVLPRLLQRRGRWYLDMGWLSLPPTANTSQQSTPVSSNPASPVDEDQAPLLHLPFNIQAAPRGASPHSESSAHRILDAVLRMRNRALSSLVGRSPPPSPLTPPATPSRHRRRRGNRGVLFFLPAVFTQNQDVELSSYRTTPRPFSRTVPAASTFPPEKQRYAADLEQAGLYGDEVEDMQFTSTDNTNRSADDTAFSTHGH
jgi:hypothetical protein